MSEPFPHGTDELLDAINAVYADDWPAGFPDAYAVMECLGEGQGCDTFLVQDADETQFVAKRYAKAVWGIDPSGDILQKLDHPNLPRHVAAYEDERSAVIVRTYIEGSPLDRYARENNLDEQGIAGIVAKLCDVLAYLHHRPEPVIHRDIKPQNVIVRPDGSVALIDFDIARTYRAGSETDTMFFGTRAYAAPEQYGFAQTDARADIYSLGVLLRYLLTGSPRENRNVRVNRALGKVIDKCTAFDPQKRYSDVDQVKKALLHANPRWQKLRIGGIAIVAAVVIGFAAFGAVKAYEAATYSPFAGEHAPAVADDEGAIADAVAYLKDRYGTGLFDGDTGEYATMGLVRQVLVDFYGFDRDFVYAYQAEGDLPGEGDGSYFIPWDWGDEQHVDRDYAVYFAVKAHDPGIVAEDQWDKLKEDTGEYPGAMVAVLFANEHGITAGVGRPFDITKGELALILANTDRVFE